MGTMARKNLRSITAANGMLLLVAGLGTACTGVEDRRDGDIWAGAEGEEEPGEAPGELPTDADLPPTSEIYGGTNVATCGWPTTVSLGGSCTGTLVHERVVIYAAHCGTGYSSVRLGESINGGSGRTAATVLGGVAGAAVGNQVMRNQQGVLTSPGYRITMQSDQGVVRTFEVPATGDLRVGDRVRVDNGVIYRG